MVHVLERILDNSSLLPGAGAGSGLKISGAGAVPKQASSETLGWGQYRYSPVEHVDKVADQSPMDQTDRGAVVLTDENLDQGKGHPNTTVKV